MQYFKAAHVSGHDGILFAESVAELSFAPVVARGSEDMLLLVSRQNRYLASVSPGDEDALNGSFF
jgi:hypothetical protein